jgi:hypothetical protein
MEAPFAKWMLKSSHRQNVVRRNMGAKSILFQLQPCLKWNLVNLSPQIEFLCFDFREKGQYTLWQNELLEKALVKSKQKQDATASGRHGIRFDSVACVL